MKRRASNEASTEEPTARPTPAPRRQETRTRHEARPAGESRSAHSPRGAGERTTIERTTGERTARSGGPRTRRSNHEQPHDEHQQQDEAHSTERAERLRGRRARRRVPHGVASAYTAWRAELDNAVRVPDAGEDESAAPEEDADPAAVARARRRKRIFLRRNSLWNMLMLTGGGIVSLFLLVLMGLSYRDYMQFQSQVELKRQELQALKKQERIGQRRLSSLQMAKGREQSLVEHGYVRPGQRILLFPTTPEEQRAAAIPENDLSPRPPQGSDIVDGSNGSGGSSSAWSRAGNAMRGWWNALQSAAGTPQKKENTNDGAAKATPTGTP